MNLWLTGVVPIVAEFFFPKKVGQKRKVAQYYNFFQSRKTRFRYTVGTSNKEQPISLEQGTETRDSFGKSSQIREFLLGKFVHTVVTPNKTTQKFSEKKANKASFLNKGTLCLICKF